MEKWGGFDVAVLLLLAKHLLGLLAVAIRIVNERAFESISPYNFLETPILNSVCFLHCCSDLISKPISLYCASVSSIMEDDSVRV